LGDGEWAVIDSCRTARGTREPAALRYLADIAVDPSAVKLVVATHWHDDHIKGLAAVFSAAPQAEFVYAAALDQEEFYAVVETHDERSAAGDYSSGVREMRTILKELDERGMKAKPAFQDMLVARVGRSEVHALSPSPKTYWRAQQFFRPYLIPGATATIPRPNRNDLSIVLWIECADQLVLLGGDLEGIADPGVGWQGVLAALVPAGRKASLFKVPHHGSAGADHPETWVQLLEGDVPAGVTPYTRLVDPLPTAGDRARINTATPNALIAGGPLGRVRRESLVRRMIGSVAIVEPRRATGPLGQIRFRAPIGSGGPAAWAPAVSGPAGPL